MAKRVDLVDITDMVGRNGRVCVNLGFGDSYCNARAELIDLALVRVFSFRTTPGPGGDDWAGCFFARR